MGFQDVIEIAELIMELHKEGMLRDPHLLLGARHVLVANNPSILLGLISNPAIVQRLRLLRMQLERKKQKDPFYPPPMREEVENLRGDILLGYARNRVPFYLRLNDLIFNIQVYGEPGSGKTTLITSLIDKICRLAERKFNVIIFDTKGDYHHLVKDHPNFLFLRKEDIFYNLFEPIPQDNPEDWAVKAIEVLADEIYYIDLMKRAMTEALKRLYQNAKEYKGLRVYPTFSDLKKETRAYFIQLKRDPLVKGGGLNFKDQILSLDVRLSTFIEAGVGFNIPRGYPFEWWAEKDFIIDVSDLPPDVTRTFIISLMFKLMRYNEMKGLRGKGLNNLIICDEAYYLADQTRKLQDVDFGKSFRELLRKKREFGVGFVFGGQEPSSITESVRNNSSTLISFRTRAAELEHVKVLGGFTEEQTQYLLSDLPPSHVFAIRSPRINRPILLKTDLTYWLDKSLSVEDVADCMRPVLDPVQTELIYFAQEAREFFEGRPATQDEDGAKGSVDNAFCVLLKALSKKPFTTKSKVKDLVGWSEAKTARVLDDMSSIGLIEYIKCRGKGRSPLTLIAITQKGKEVCGLSRIISPHLFEHTFYCNMAVVHLSKNGIEAKKEFAPEGYEGEGRIDVAYQSADGLTAIEVTLSFENFTQNLQKCVRFGANRIIIICRDKKGVVKAQGIVESAGLDVEVRVMTVTGFLNSKNF